MSTRLLALVALLVGCSGRTTVGSDASIDPWVLDAPDLDVLDAGRCMIETIGDCAPVEGESTLFTADATSRIVAVRPPFVLLDPLRVVYVGSDGTGDTLTPRELDDSGLRAISIALESAAKPFVLACGASACRVFEVLTKDTPGLARVGPELPATTRAIAVLDGKIWVAGDGVRRLDGATWSLERAEGRFHALAAAFTDDGSTVAAVGEGGVVAVRAHDAWTTTTAGVNDTLINVDLRDYVIAASSERGALFLGTRSGFQPCTGPTLGVRSLSFVQGPWLRLLFGTTNDERSFTLDAAGAACRSESIPGLRGGAMFSCGVSMNRWRFTATELVGTYRCAIE